MPIKWTPETDQILLLKILETSQISVDVKAISAAWPKDQEAPTPRAISERLVKIRTLAKENGTDVKFSVSSGKNTSTPTTPRKGIARPVKSKKAAGVGKKVPTKKRKLNEKEDVSDSEDSGADADQNEHMEEGNSEDDTHAQGEV